MSAWLLLACQVWWLCWWELLPQPRGGGGVVRVSLAHSLVGVLNEARSIGRCVSGEILTC